MAHRRKEIRDAVIAALLGEDAPTSYPTLAEDRVVNNRVSAWPVRLLSLGPAISVYAVEEGVVPASKQTAPKRLERQLQLAIEAAVVASPAGDVDDTCDAIAVEIERVMHADPTFGGLCGESILVQTDIEVNGDGATEVGNIRLLYEVTYYTNAPDEADVPLDDLHLSKGVFDLEGIQAELDETGFEADHEDPAIFLDASPELPEEHDDPQVLAYEINVLLALGRELWIDAAASDTPGLELLAHSILITHTDTGTLIKTTAGILPVAGRVLDVFDDTDLIALGVAGHFRIDVKDNMGAIFASLPFTLTP